MEFHQSDFERLAEKIFTHICKEFDGLCVGTNECDFDAMKKSLPYDLEKDNTQSPTSNNEEQEEQNESFTDNIDENNDSPSPKVKEENKENKVNKEKKEKIPKEKIPKEKKPKKEKVPKALNGYMFYKDNADIKLMINKYIEDNDITDKRAASGLLWKSLSEDERKEWSQKSKDDFTEKQSQKST